MTPEQEHAASGLGYLLSMFGKDTLRRLRESLHPATRYQPLDVRSSLRCPLAIAGQASFQELRVRLNLNRDTRVALGFEPRDLSQAGWKALQAAWVTLLEKK